MFTKSADKICRKLCENGIIKTDDKELYIFGVVQLFTIALNILTTVVIGFLFHNILQILAFLLAYIPVRIYSGGYHCRTAVRCYFFSCVILVITEIIMRFITFDIVICAAMLILTGVVYVLLSPVEDANKPFDEKEKVVFRRLSLVIFTFEGIAGLLLVLISNSFGAAVILAVLCEGIMLILGKLKNITRSFTAAKEM